MAMAMVKATALAVAAILATVGVLFALFDPDFSVPIGLWAYFSAVYGGWVLRAQQTATACSGMYAMCGAWLLSAQVMVKAYSGTYVMYAVLALASLASLLLLGVINWYVVKYRVVAVNPDVWDLVQLSFHRGAGSFGHLYVLLAQLNPKAGLMWVIDTVYHLLVCVVTCIWGVVLYILALGLGRFMTESHRQFIHMVMYEVRVGVTCIKVAEGCVEYNEKQQDPSTSDTKLTAVQFAALIRPTLLAEHAEAFRVCQHPVATDKITPAPHPVPVNFEDYMRLDDTQVRFKRRFDAFNAQQEQERHAWPELSYDAYLRFVNVTPETQRGLPAMIDRPDAALYAGGTVHKRQKFVRNYPGVDAMEIEPADAAAAPAAAGGAGAADAAAAAAPAGPVAAGGAGV
jgi:hypothetical protein